jgi:hypothetical protein
MDENLPTPEAPKNSRGKPPSHKGKPGLTKLEREARIDFAAGVLLRHPRKTDQVNAIRKEFGICERMAETWLRYARERILAASKRPKEEFLAESLHFYESLAADMTVAPRDRIAARKQLDRCVGNGIGVKVEMVNPEAGLMPGIDLAAIAQRSRQERLARQRQEQAEELEPTPVPGDGPIGEE